MYVYHATVRDIPVTVFRDKLFFKKALLTPYLEEQGHDDIIVVKLSEEINFISSSWKLQNIYQLVYPKIVILSFSQIQYIDDDGESLLEDIIEHFEHIGTTVYLTGITDAFAQRLHSTTFFEKYHNTEYCQNASSVVLNGLHICHV